jgi:tetratricopeptide (TPR) repeat protein
MRRLVCLLFVVALALFAAPPRARADARAMRPEARAHYDKGLKLYARHQYDDAIAELRAGLAIDPQPEILYALGQAERRRGHCDRAVEYYQSCLALVKDPVAAAAVKVQIERCNVAQGDNKEEAEQLPGPDPFAPGAPQPPPNAAPPPATEPAPAPPAPALQATPPVQAPAPTTVASAPPRRARWQHDALGLSLLGAGAAVAITGGVLFGVAESRLDAAGDGYQQYADARSAPTLRAVGIGGLALGGVLVVVGVVRLALVGARR